MKIKVLKIQLAMIRIKKGFSINMLSKASKVGKSTIMKMEQEENYYPNAATTKRICDALDITFDESFVILEQV
jgi:DNA-binding XRE family transcriptional regulator